jgi:tetratricopeptide (TPR) repeat protein
LSLKIRRDLGIPEQHIMDAKDLPVSEIGTTSVRALKSFIDGAKAITFESNFDKGLRCLEQSVTEDPTFAYGHEAIQLIAFYMNQREKREQAFKSLMQYLYKLPERVQYFIKASYYSFREDKEKQIAVLKMMVGLNPEETEGHRQLAEIYSGRNQWAEALSEFRRILEIDPGQKEALLRIGSLYEQEGEPKEALKYYEKYAAQYPEEVKSFTTIGDLYRTTGDFERAKSYYKKALLIEPENLPVLITMADIDADLGNFEGSEKICQDALKNANTPEDRARIFGSLASLFKTQGRYRRALEYVRLLMDEENKSQPALGALLNKITHLEAFIRAGKKDEAFQRVEEFRSQAAAPFNELIPFGYLFYYVEVEDAEKATQALKEAEATPLGPNTEGNKPGIIYFKGRVHEMKGEYEQAIAAYREYLKARPADLSINMFIGRSYRKLREFKKAEDSMQKCLKTSPYDPDLHYELALLYIDTKDKTKALEHLNVALNIWKNADPGIREVEDARMRLASLTGS